MANPVPLRKVDGQVGKYLLADGSELNVSRVRDDYVIDSVGMASGTITADRKRNFFTQTNGTRNKQHFFGLSSNNRMPQQTALLAIMRIGLYVQQAIGNTLITTDDACKLYCNSHVYLRLDAKDDIYDGLGLGLPSGLGVWGATGDTSSPFATSGTPSMLSTPEVHPDARWPVRDNNTFSGYIDWPDATWLDDANMAGASTYAPAIITVACAITLYFRGPIATA